MSMKWLPVPLVVVVLLSWSTATRACALTGAAYVRTHRSPAARASHLACQARPSVHDTDDLATLGVAGLPLEDIVRGFQRVSEPKLRYRPYQYQQLLLLAKQLPEMPRQLQSEDHRVPGCSSTVLYVAAERDDRGIISFQGTADSVLFKGIVSLLVNGLSGCTNEQIQGLRADFIFATGLEHALTAGQENDFHNLCAMMKRQAAALTRTR
jgi:cysteine desulfuration protein SufE